MTGWDEEPPLGSILRCTCEFAWVRGPDGWEPDGVAGEREARTWEYVRESDLPDHPLHLERKGFHASVCPDKSNGEAFCQCPITAISLAEDAYALGWRDATREER